MLRVLLTAAALIAVSSGAKAGFLEDLARAAEDRADHRVYYDPSYVAISYPMGDVPAHTGVCTDVVIRSYRAVGVDLQEAVHKDMKRNFSRYPKIWGLKRPDTNIDHRRVPNLETFLKRRGAALPISSDPTAFKPGDVVTWRLADGRPHMGIVTTQKTAQGIPLISHNIGAGPQIEDMLFALKIHGHFRWDGR
ncbi:MAG: DUF1287 domain-containing protein [Pseudomonadota bacterium]